MKTLLITKEHLDDENYYIGKKDVTNFDGNITIDKNLGLVRFKKSIILNGTLVARAGTGIKAGYGIEAGYGIKAGYGIEAGYGIKAGDGIEAGTGIKAGWGIEAGYGIKAGLSISCKTIFSNLRIFAGLSIWKIPTPEEKQIVCEELLRGEIAYGELVIVKPSITTCEINC
jgi:hypothetical protein